jgi:hypothetical protein
LYHCIILVTGTSANDKHFQAYLVEGLMRWNEDRASAATTGSEGDTSCSYSALLRHAANQLGQRVLGRPLVPGYQVTRAYTGKNMIDFDCKFCFISDKKSYHPTYHSERVASLGQVGKHTCK